MRFRDIPQTSNHQHGHQDEMGEHFILKGRLVGTDEGWADCICGWHYEGTVKGSIEAGERHLKENEPITVCG